MTQSREQFEAHYDGWCNEGFQGYTESMRMGNSYKLPSIAVAWAHWQASRDSLRIRMPMRPYASEEDQEQMSDYEIGEGHGGIAEWDKCRDAIHAAGIKTNPPT